jgi:hypothetical protein
MPGSQRWPGCGTFMPAADPLAAGEEIDGLVSDLRAAGNGGYQWVTGRFFLELTLRKPGGNGGAG